MNLSKVVLTITTLFLLVGCSSTPEDAVLNVYNGIKKGDMPKLIKNSNYAIRGVFIRSALFECSLDKSKYVNDDLKLVENCLREKYGKIKVKISSTTMLSEVEADINITMQSNSQELKYQLKVAKIEHKWKVISGK
ncbi:MAG: DUF4878 domain-containing protein [Sulfurimonas sp.]